LLQIAVMRAAAAVGKTAVSASRLPSGAACSAGETGEWGRGSDGQAVGRPTISIRYKRFTTPIAQRRVQLKYTSKRDIELRFLTFATFVVKMRLRWMDRRTHGPTDVMSHL